MSFHPVYPGHPVPLAIQAMEHFSRASDALRHTKYGWSELVGSCAVTGAGDSAHNAEMLIRKIQCGELLPHDAVLWADGIWRYQVGPGTGNHEDQFIEGLVQAKALRSRFLETCREWDWS